MVDSFLEFIESLADCSIEFTPSLAKLDQEASPIGGPTRNRTLRFHSDVGERNDGSAVVFGSILEASSGLIRRQQATRERALLLRAQRTIGGHLKGTLLLLPHRAGNIRQAHFLIHTAPNHDPSPPSPSPAQTCIPELPENGRPTLEYSRARSCRQPSQRRKARVLCGFPVLNQQTVRDYG